MTTSPSEVSLAPASGEAPVYDVAVIGAGPAGLAAAVAAAEGGASVALVDAGPRPGGQFWRHRAGDDGSRHHGWAAFARLRAALDAEIVAGGLAHLARHLVWHAERGTDGAPFTVHALLDGEGREVRARTLVIATGAYDRQLPFPGWTLPGVFTAGAAQAMLKGQGVLVGRRIAVGGTGPFLLPVAAGLVEAGAEVVGVFEAGRPAAFARHPLAVLRASGKLLEGAGYLWTLRRHGVPYRMRTAIVEALGEESVTGVRIASLDGAWNVVPGSERTIECDTVAVGYGFTPQTETPLQLGCEMTMDRDGSLVVRVDDEGRSSAGDVFVAGEATGIGGAELALAEGELAGLHAAAAARGRATDPGRLRPIAGRRARGRTFAAALAEAYPVRPGWRTWLRDDTIVCRCEEVTVAGVHAAVDDLGATDPRTAKLFARAGMGLCQGRVCGYANAGLVAARCGREVTAADLAGTSARPIAQPVPLSVLAAPREATPPDPDR
jgi:NADPH-dependent 2,4-dienoyl-CoA reductase/sulfur reductase-like enzyme